MSKKIFFLILAGLSARGILLVFAIEYITAPVKEIKIEKTEEKDKTVLPSTVETALAKKQEPKKEKTKQSTGIEDSNQVVAFSDISNAKALKMPDIK